MNDFVRDFKRLFEDRRAMGTIFSHQGCVHAGTRHSDIKVKVVTFTDKSCVCADHTSTLELPCACSQLAVFWKQRRVHG